MWIEHVRIAWRALSGHALRSLLTVSSIMVGALAIVLASSLAEAALRTLMRNIEELGGARLVLLAPKVPERAEKKAAAPRGFEARDRELVTAGVPHLAGHALYAGLGMRDARSDAGRVARTDLVAADAGFFEVFRMRIDRGRPLEASDEERASNACVVGPALAKALWDAPPLGRNLTIGALRCRVVGVFADNERWGMGFGFDWNHLVVVPHRTALLAEPGVRQASTIALFTDGPAFNDPVKRIVNARLVRVRGDVDDFTFFDLGTVVERFEATFAIMKLLVGLVAAIALAIGGIGVMNMMLVSVSERTKEIGVRKALGAAPSDLSTQFLVEAALSALGGGVLGVLGGAGLALAAGFVIRQGLASWVSAVSVPAMAVALLLSLAIGVGFGWLPARRAARLSPVEAMRR